MSNETNVAQTRSGRGRASLLSLPTEIRLQIYSYLFRVNSTIPFLDGFRACEWSPFPGLGLIRTCKELHAELADQIYIKNAFRFHITFQFCHYYFTSVQPELPVALLHPSAVSNLGIYVPAAQNLMNPLNGNVIARLRSIALKIEIAEWQFEEGFESIRDAFHTFVDTVADPSGKPYNLHSLSVTLTVYASYPSLLPEPADKEWANCIEPLARLYGMKSVEIRGPVMSPLKEELVWVMKRNERVGMPRLQSAEIAPWPTLALELDWGSVAELMKAEKDIKDEAVRPPWPFAFVEESHLKDHHV